MKKCKTVSENSWFWAPKKILFRKKIKHMDGDGIYLPSSPLVSTNRTKFIFAERIKFSLNIEFNEYNTVGCMKRWGGEQEQHELSYSFSILQPYRAPYYRHYEQLELSFSFSILQPYRAPYYRHYVAVKNTVLYSNTFFKEFRWIEGRKGRWGERK